MRSSFVGCLLGGLLIACTDQGPTSSARVIIDVPGETVAVGALSGSSWVEVRGRVTGAPHLDRLTYQVDGGGEVTVDVADLSSDESTFVIAIDGLALGEHVIGFKTRDREGRTYVAPTVSVAVVPALREVPLPIPSHTAFPTDINALGDVTGYFLDADLPTFHAFVHSGGESRRLAPEGTWRSMASSLNDAGDVAGFVVAQRDGPPSARIWRGTAATMPMLQSAAATAINGAGVLAGAVFPDGMAQPPRGFVRRDGIVTTFGDADRSTTVSGISESGDMVGTSVGPGGSFAFIYTAGQLQPIATLGGVQAYGRGINDAGTVVGFSEPQDRTTYRAFRAKGTSVVALRRADQTDVAAYAYKVNDRDIVVGEYITTTGDAPQHWAFIATGDELVSIEERLGPGVPPMLGAYAINDRGEIAVAAINAEGLLHPFIVALPGGPEARRAQLQLGTPSTHPARQGKAYSQALEEHRARRTP